MKTKCIIVDDEPLAIEAIDMHLEHFNEIEVVARCSNAMEAFEVLKKKNVDLMFLDIQMPKITGISFIKSLSNPPKIVITTAYPDYAVEGFELEVIDYLLKPIPFERFMAAIDKFYKLREKGIAIVKDNNEAPAEKNYMFVRSERKMVKVFFDEILYIESLKDYVQIKTKSRNVITKNQISTFENILPANLFLRIHRSYIVSIDKIDAVAHNTIIIGKYELPIAKSCKTNVMHTLNLEENILGN